MIKLCTVVGARPQFVKAAALERAIKTYNRNQDFLIDHVLVHTGQHFDVEMSDVFFEEMEISSPDYHLGVGGGSHGAVTGRMLEKVEAVLIDESPDWLLVYGDTNSTLAGALAAAKLHIPVAHVEAGMRSHNRKMPEEINRIIADHCSNLLFTSTTEASNQLKNEGIFEGCIRQVGDVMYDVALFFQEKALSNKNILQNHRLLEKKYALVTIHRAENTDDIGRLCEIFEGLKLLTQITTVVIPLHPRTRQALQKLEMLEEIGKTLLLIDPVGYFDMVCLESCAEAIITDSGGVQKEAYFFQVPCLTLREETEWKELIQLGCNRLVAAKRQNILDAYQEMKNVELNWVKDLYGHGDASVKIIETLTSQ